MKILITATTLSLIGCLTAPVIWAAPLAETEKEEVNEGLITPLKGTPEFVVLEGLKLIADGKFNRWVKRYCHKAKLCLTPMAVKSLKEFNLKAARKLVPHCLRGKARAKLHITRREEVGNELKLFLACHADGMPRPFTLEREGGAWKFRRI
ncbi:MAG: hypothetical protein ACPGU1_17445 [Myxococcota bacterium]